MLRLLSRGTATVFAYLFSVAALAQLNIPSDGSDGAFSYTNLYDPYTFDLSQAVTANWDAPSPNPGKGVYDPNLWAVVYKFSSMNVVTNNSIRFTPHPSGAPVVFLVQGNATLTGSWQLSGANHAGTALSLPAPGGFRGGAGLSILAGSAGFGPGGGNYTPGAKGGAGSHSTLGTGLAGALYGNPRCIPLIGGSGGSGHGNRGTGGCSGGGAILIACGGTLAINSGGIYCNGGTGNYDDQAGGSGGSIRLISQTLTCAGTLSAQGGYGQANTGGQGRIRIEAVDRTLTGSVLPTPSLATPPETPQIWPDSTTPQLQISAVAGIGVPADPRANLYQPDVELSGGGDKVVTVLATNVPVDGTWVVQVRMTPRNGKESFATCTYVSGNQGLSTWQCTLNFDAGAAAMIARAYKQ